MADKSKRVPGKTLVIFSAACGGFFPTLFTLAVKLTSGQSELPESTFWIGLLLMGLIGAIVGWLWQEENIKKAFFLGLSIPALFSSSVATLSDTQQTVPNLEAYSFVSTAMAQDGELLIATALNRTLKIITDEIKNDCAVDFFNSEGRRLQRIFVEKSKEQAIINVPETAAEVSIYVDNSTSNKISLSMAQNSLTTIKLSIKKKSWSGFRTALGFKGVSSYEVKIEKIE